MSRLLLLFVVVPAVELVLLIEIGRQIGTLPTLGLIVVTGALGAYLARRQGLGVLRRMRQETAAGQLPAAPVMDGIIILIAGALLVTPGILTDAFVEVQEFGSEIIAAGWRTGRMRRRRRARLRAAGSGRRTGFLLPSPARAWIAPLAEEEGVPAS